ncbi:hypothetical protein QM012_002423 [Aureobasidium pullulans]|uniref:Uncharacterized protein n=1 Tax=Aureobasidium pullulans TaxID=5580 RepID=A0ABR0TBW2_AURPU
MDDPVNHDCITVRLLWGDPYLDKFTSVFIKREGRGPTAADWIREVARYQAAYKKEDEMMTARLVKETGIGPDFLEVYAAVSRQLEDPGYNSDYTPCYRWMFERPLESPWWTEMREKHSSRSNPLDLTERSRQSSPNTSTKRQKTDLRQTSTSPPGSTRSRSLSITSRPKQRSSQQQTQPQSPQSSPQAPLQPDINAKMAKLRTKIMQTITNEASPQRPVPNPLKRSFEDLMNVSGPGLSVQPRDFQPSATIEKLPKQLIFTRTRSEDSSTIDKRQLLARPSFIRQDSMPSLLDSEDKLNDVHLSGYNSPFRFTAVKDNHTAELSYPRPSSISPQRPAPTQTTDNHIYARDFLVQLSAQIHDYIEEAVGNVDDRVQKIFNDVALRTSLWILDNTPSSNALLQSIDSQIDNNDRNARAVNKSLEEVLDACGSKAIGLSPQATDHCKLLDQQEKERQKALEDMVEKLERSKQDKTEVMEAIGAMRRDIKEEKDACNQKEVEEMRKIYGE